MATSANRNLRAAERGAVLVHVSIAIIGLAAFAALTIDYGIMWTSRRQAQNAADAAALAGASSLAFDAPDDWDRARENAEKIGESNQIFGQAPDIIRGSGFSQITTEDISFPPCPPGSPGAPDDCIRVNVYRNQGRNPLPTYFARLLGITSQGVRATATAQIVGGTDSECVKPWGVADKWINNWEDGKALAPPAWDENSYFDKYDKFGNIDPAITPPDVYVPPTYDADGVMTDPGSGYRPFDDAGNPVDYGRILTLKMGTGPDQDRISSGWFKILDLPTADPMNSGADKVRYTIKHCNGVALGPGDLIPVQTGAEVGPTAQGVEGGGPDDGTMALIPRDPKAYWDPITKTIKESCAPGYCADGKYYAQSPRIVPVPVFDVAEYLSGGPTGSNEFIRITRVLGFFIQEMPNNKDVTGVLINVPTQLTGPAGPANSTFLNTVILVR